MCFFTLNVRKPQTMSFVALNVQEPPRRMGLLQGQGPSESESLTAECGNSPQALIGNHYKPPHFYEIHKEIYTFSQKYRP